MNEIWRFVIPAIHKTKLLAHLSMLVFAALISGSFSFGHLAAPFLDPAALNAMRFLFAFGIMLVIGLVRYRQVPIVFVSPWRFVILGGLSAIYFITMFMALKITSPIATGAVFTLVPLLSTGFGWLFLRQKTSLRVWTGLMVAACGALWIIFKGDLGAALRFDVGAGELIFFIGCVAYAAYSPLIRKLNRGESTYAFTVSTLLACLLVTVAVGFVDIVQASWGSLPIMVWLVIVYLSVFTTAVTFFLLQFASMNLPASKVLSYGYLIPVFVVFYEGVMGHGWAGISVLLGVLLTVAALIITLISSDQK